MLILATETSDRRLRSLRLKMAKSLKPLSLFLSWLIFFLSPLSASVVTHLPGFDGALPFYLETGYVGVDEANGGELFYYFIESEGNPRDDPLFLWLTGGPRCSAFSGLAFEVGPLKFVTAEYNGSLPSLVYHPYSWTKVANMIFLDSPLGSGFSFAKNIERYYADDISWSEHAYKFLIKWFNDHPQFLSNPLYIAGDSYAGKIVPIVTQLVLDGIDAGKQPQFNLQGYIIGNPSTGERVDENSRVPFAHGMAIISNSFYKLTQRSCQGQDYTNPTNAQCASCLDTFDQIVSEINRPQILELKCIPEYFEYFMPRIRNQDRRILKEKLNLFAPPPFPDIRCRSYAYVLSYYWANNVAVRQALHIKEGTVPEWVRCEKTLPFESTVQSSLKYHLDVLRRGCRGLVYSGDHDFVVPFLGTQAWIESLNSSIVDHWRSWRVDDQIAGYTTLYSNNLTFATVKGAGHTAPEYKAQECLAMIRRWTSHQPL